MAKAANAKPRSGLTRVPAKRRPRKAAGGSRGLLPDECRFKDLGGDAAGVRERVVIRASGARVE